MKATQGRVVFSSVIVSLLGLIASVFYQAGTFDLLAGLFVLGWIAGWFARRRGWLCGIIVGAPIALFQLIRLALRTTEPGMPPFPDGVFGTLLFPAAVVSTGAAILGGLVGAWMHDMRLQG